MWNYRDVTVDIAAVEGSTMIVTIATPSGMIEIIGHLIRVDRTLLVEGAHVQGLSAGLLGRAGLNAIGRRMLEEADVDSIVIEGGTRTTGRRKGKRPRAIRFPHPAPPEG